MSDRRRWVYIPEINANTYLLFYWKGDTGSSYSLRDYSGNGPKPVTHYSKSYPYSAEEILLKATHDSEALDIPTNSFDYWHEETMKLNRTLRR